MDRFPAKHFITSLLLVSFAAVQWLGKQGGEEASPGAGQALWKCKYSRGITIRYIYPGWWTIALAVPTAPTRSSSLSVPAVSLPMMVVLPKQNMVAIALLFHFILPPFEMRCNAPLLGTLPKRWRALAWQLVQLVLSFYIGWQVRVRAMQICQTSSFGSFKFIRLRLTYGKGGGRMVEVGWTRQHPDEGKAV